MKKLAHILFVMFMFSTYSHTNAAEITKADILKTLHHIQSLAQEQKNELDKAQWDYNQQGIQLKQETDFANQLKTKEFAEHKGNVALSCIIGLMLSIWVGSVFCAGFVRNWPFPYGILLAIAIIAGAFFGGIFLGELVIAGLSQLVPDWLAHIIP